ncbi:MAG: hypothetical protein JOS17DRAFT_589166 [Linnemannia elongata]|nr:MAG: hypothetical protein JOS17DRAFT_589166 [Linnemannia elongata]
MAKLYILEFFLFLFLFFWLRVLFIALFIFCVMSYLPFSPTSFFLFPPFHYFASPPLLLPSSTCLLFFHPKLPSSLGHLRLYYVPFPPLFSPFDHHLHFLRPFSSVPSVQAYPASSIHSRSAFYLSFLCSLSSPAGQPSPLPFHVTHGLFPSSSFYTLYAPLFLSLTYISVPSFPPPHFDAIHKPSSLRSLPL